MLSVGRRQAGAKLEQGGMLRAQVLVNVLIELLVGTGRLGCVKIATARNVAIGRVEVESGRDGLELLDWEVLARGQSMSRVWPMSVRQSPWRLTFIVPVVQPSESDSCSV